MLGISLTALKQVCRKLGVQRWPYWRRKKSEGTGGRYAGVQMSGAGSLRNFEGQREAAAMKIHAHTHAYPHARTHARTQAHTHTHARARTHTHTHTHNPCEKRCGSARGAVEKTSCLGHTTEARTSSSSVCISSKQTFACLDESQPSGSLCLCINSHQRSPHARGVICICIIAAYASVSRGCSCQVRRDVICAGHKREASHLNDVMSSALVTSARRHI